MYPFLHSYTKLFALFALFVPTSFLFAATSPKDSFPFRFYCVFASMVGNNSENCFQKTEIETANITESSDALRALEAKIVSLEQKAQNNARLPQTVASAIATQPETVIKYIYVKGEKGDKGDQGERGVSLPSIQSATHFSSQAFQYIPQPFWNGGGSSGNTSGGTIINNTISPLPTGGTLGQVLTINASGTPEWILPVISTSSLAATLFAQNGLTLSTTSTSTLVELGGLLTKDTAITQGTSNLRFDRSFASLVNQGTTSWPINGSTFTANNFAGLIASTTNTNITAGINDRSGAAFSLYEVSNTQIAGAVTNNGALLIAPTLAQITFANNQGRVSTISATVNGARLRAQNNSSSEDSSFFLSPSLTTIWQSFSPSGFTNITFSSSTGVRFGSNLGGYTFPRTNGAVGDVLSNDGFGNVSWVSGTFPVIAENGLSFSTSSTSSIVELGGLLNKNTLVTQSDKSIIFSGANTTTGRNTFFKLGRGGSGFSDFDLTATTTNTRISNKGSVGLADASISNDVAFTGNPLVNSVVSESKYVEDSFVTDTKSVFIGGSQLLSYDKTVSAALGGSTSLLEQLNYSNGFNQQFNRNITVEAPGGILSSVETLDWADGLGSNNSQIFFNRNISTNNDAAIELGISGIFGASTTNQTLQIDKSGISFGGSGSVSTLGYTFPKLRGASSTVMALNASGVLSFVPLSSLALGGGTTAQNGLLQVSTSTVELGGTLLRNTTINQSFRDLSFTYITASAPLTLMNGGLSFNLQPAYPYNLTLAGGFSTTSYAGPTSLAFGRTALGLSTSFAGLSEDTTDFENPYFNARNYIALSDGSADVNVINNSMYGPEMSYYNYGSTVNEIRKRSYVQARNDGGAYITGSDESLFTRADMVANANGGILLRSSNYPTSTINAEYNSSVLGGIVLSHTAPGFSTTLTLSTTTGVTISNMLGIGLSSPLATLHVATTSASAVARFDNANGYCEINPTSASLICTSDRTLKKNITSLESTTLSKLALLNPVTYNWLREADGVTPQYGFIAQDVESIFPTLVYTNIDTGVKTLSYTSLIPITVQALKDLNLALGDFTATSSTPESFADSSIFKKILAGLEWMGVKIEKGIVRFENLFAKEATIERLCFDNDKTVCLTKDEVTRILQATQVTGAPAPTPSEDPQPSDTSATSTSTDDTVEILEDEVVENQEEVVVVPLIESTQVETPAAPEI